MAPIPCLKGCGFFGNPDQRNLCSQCYKDEILASVRTSIQKQIHLEKEMTDLKVEPVVPLPAIKTKTVTKTTKRCESCKKKIGLTGFSCKCGGEFCSSHRLPETHHCSIDFKGSGKNSIAKNNPVVKADKVHRI
ncbi:zinc finger A20 and AN1 domain-containing stress-associated protein 1-like [Dioscorea cayenensis subsp. rotundata]|uniref:Zinc finger A20 and AN1 domain-containing stress-associated protein 1-like n=1 Tax=Dioscorea cayennensis subsp. rotundata TaxID=55577 RepID=A0AB40ARP6_DIOCR|nr:zinc finger A20 and AN1 domain-containing stress-associated protein 1-like [Dioscorea cayenensis subsp. rotundata]